MAKARDQMTYHWDCVQIVSSRKTTTRAIWCREWWRRRRRRCQRRRRRRRRWRSRLNLDKIKKSTKQQRKKERKRSLDGDPGDGASSASDLRALDSSSDDSAHYRKPVRIKDAETMTFGQFSQAHLSKQYEILYSKVNKASGSGDDLALAWIMKPGRKHGSRAVY